MTITGLNCFLFNPEGEVKFARCNHDTLLKGVKPQDEAEFEKHLGSGKNKNVAVIRLNFMPVRLGGKATDVLQGSKVVFILMREGSMVTVIDLKGNHHCFECTLQKGEIVYTG